jgi:hypothetical protein
MRAETDRFQISIWVNLYQQASKLSCLKVQNQLGLQGVVIEHYDVDDIV